MYVQVLGQALLHTLLAPVLLVWSVIFCVLSFFSNGNAVTKPKVIVITGARYLAIRIILIQ